MRVPQMAVRIFVLTGTLALLGGEAQADDCHCDHNAGYRTARGCTPVIRSGAGTYSYRDPCHTSTRYVIPRHRHLRGRTGCRPRSYGTPWSVLRRYLPTGRDEIRRLHVRNYFLRRYPFALAPEADASLAHVDTLLAIGGDDAQHPRKLDRAGRLDRGTARYFVRDYDGARADFDAVLKEAPKEHRARWGLLFVAVCKNEWKTAAAELGTLAKAGELRRDDRAAFGGTMEDATIVPSVIKGLREYAGYATGDSDAHLVTAWALAYQGDRKAARTYVRIAKRGKASHPAVKALDALLKPAPQPAPAQTPAQTPADAPAKVEETERAPKVQLHREVASIR